MSTLAVVTAVVPGGAPPVSAGRVAALPPRAVIPPLRLPSAVVVADPRPVALAAGPVGVVAGTVALVAGAAALATGVIPTVPVPRTSIAAASITSATITAAAEAGGSSAAGSGTATASAPVVPVAPLRASADGPAPRRSVTCGRTVPTGAVAAPVVGAAAGSTSSVVPRARTAVVVASSDAAGSAGSLVPPAAGVTAAGAGLGPGVLSRRGRSVGSAVLRVHGHRSSS